MGYLLASALVLMVPLGIYALVAEKRDLERAWGKAAGRAGMKDIVLEASLLNSDILTGRAGRRVVHVGRYAQAKSDRGVRITIEGASGITLRRESQVAGLDEAMRAREIQVGDEVFDREVYVHGHSGAVRSVLDKETRQLVLQLLRGAIPARGSAAEYLEARVAILDGDLIVEVHDRVSHVLQSNLPGVLATLLDAADRLERPPSIPARLIAISREEPEWRVRLEILALLAGSYPRHPATREALERGVQDEREEVQLEAALGLGPDGEAMLLEIASREWAADGVAARAVATLGPRLPLDRAQAILAHALRTRRREAAGACLDWMGRFGGPGVLEPLAKVLALEGGALALAAARSLGTSQQAAAEGPLLQALGNDQEEVREAAAEALGHVGTAAAVLPLKEAGARDAGLRRAARQAIAEIQSRLGPASPGRLSLAEGEAGQLSLAGEDPAGRVSMADP